MLDTSTGLRRRVRALGARTRGRQQARGGSSSFARIVGTLAFVLCSIGVAASAGEDVSRMEIQSLDERVQEVKADVLGIAAALSQLEEKLLYPSNTQVSVFVSIADGEELRLDWARIQIDGELVAHHIYSFKELQALQKGGVQRIYTGNVPTGEHRLEVSIAGKLPGGRDFNGNESFSFSKDVEPKLVGVTLAGKDLGGVSIQPRGW